MIVETRQDVGVRGLPAILTSSPLSIRPSSSPREQPRRSKRAEPTRTPHSYWKQTFPCFEHVCVLFELRCSGSEQSTGRPWSYCCASEHPFLPPNTLKVHFQKPKWTRRQKKSMYKLSTRKAALPLAIGTISLLLLAETAHAQIDARIAAPEANGLIVKFKPGTRLEMMAVLGHQSDRIQEFPGSEFVVVHTSDEGTLGSILAWHPAVEYVEPNYRCDAFHTPNDTRYSSQWYLPKVAAPAAWDITRGSNNVTIAIIDTGVQLNHPDLSAKIVPGYDFVNLDSSANDDNGHGTHCAGIAAASTDNRTGIAGVAMRCNIMPVKVLSQTGVGYNADVAAGMIWAVQNGANVLSLSLGSAFDSQVLRDAAQVAESAGALVVAAAGNSNSIEPRYPAAIPTVVAVAATDRMDQRASYSSHGSWVDVAAPGGAGPGTPQSAQILSTYLGSTYQFKSGTSMACPLVAGIGALLVYGTGRGLPPQPIRAALEAGCDSIGPWIRTGRVNARRSLLLATPPAAPSRLRRISLTSNRVDIAWDDNSINESEFVIEWSMNGGPWGWAWTVGANQTTSALGGMQPGASYRIRVLARNIGGYSAPSNILEVTPNTYPADPSHLEAVNIWATQLDLRWRDNSSDESTFRIEMKTTQSDWVYIGWSSANDPSFRVTGLQVNTDYWFRVRAFKNDVGYSGYSNVVQVRTGSPPPGPPSAPSHLTPANVWSERIDLNWRDNSNDETEFRVAISTNGGASWNNAAVVEANRTNARIDGLQPNTTYWFKVRAGNPYGYSEYCDIIAVTTRQAPPRAPSNLHRANVWARTIDVNWNDNSDNEVEFEIQISTAGSGGPWTPKTWRPVNSTGGRISDLQPNRRYWIRVGARNAEGISWSNVIEERTRAS